LNFQISKSVCSLYTGGGGAERLQHAENYFPNTKHFFFSENLGTDSGFPGRKIKKKISSNGHQRGPKIFF
jgi:hypothetical protein